MNTQKEIIDWLKNGTTKRLNLKSISGFYIQRLKNGQGSFRLVYRVGGKQSTFTIGRFPAIPYALAHKVALEKYLEVFEGVDINEDKRQQSVNKSATVGVYFKEHYLSVIERKKSAKEMARTINSNFKHLFSLRISDITTQHIKAWQLKKEREGRQHATLEKSYGTFKAMLNTAAREGFVESNPIKDYSLSKDFSNPTDSSKKQRRIYLTPEQSSSFLRALPKYDAMIVAQRESSITHGKKYLPSYKHLYFPDRVHVSMLILYYSGIRIGDVITLDWSEVNFEQKIFYFTPSKIEHKKPAPQAFPMHDKVYESLHKWWRQHNKPSKGAVFPNPKTGEPFSRDSFRKVWVTLKEIAGLPKDLNLQTLRHNFASQLIMQGVELFTIAKLMGSSIRMIENYYGHLNSEHKFSAINKMPQIDL